MVVLKLKQEILYVPLDFDNNLTVDAFVYSGAYVSPIAQIDLDTTKQKAPFITLKTDDPPNFQIQVADGQKETSLATALLNFEIEDNTIAENFVLMKKLPGPIIGFLFMSNNSVVTGTTRGLVHFPHLTMQVKTASTETTGKPQSLITDDALTIPPRTTNTITVLPLRTTNTITDLVRHPSERNHWRSLRDQQVCCFPTQCRHYFTRERQSE